MIVASLLIVLAVVIVLSVSQHHSDPATDAVVYRSTAQDLCEGLVKKALKAPTTAKFTDEVATGSRDISVTGNVSSQNSFGAMIQNPFSCTASVDADETVRVKLTSLG